MSLKFNPFLFTITELREQENLFLSEKALSITEKHKNEVAVYLESEYQRERQNYPFTAPTFNADAAIWAAQTVAIAAGLVLLRRNSAKLLSQLSICKNQIDAGAALSADLCLRFLPQLLVLLRDIDVEDPAVGVVENILRSFPYSAIHPSIEPNQNEPIELTNSRCYRQLFIERVINYKTKNWAMTAWSEPLIKQSLEPHSEVFWRDL